MVIIKVKDRFHIRKKDGSAGKNSFATKKAALNAQKRQKTFFHKKKKKSSSKSKSKGGRKSTKKKSKSVSKKKNNPGGKKMAKGSILAPVGKKGIKLPTLLTEAGIVLGTVEKGGQVGNQSALEHVHRGEHFEAVQAYVQAVNPLGNHMSGRLIKWGTGLRIIRGLVSRTPVQLGIFTI